MLKFNTSIQKCKGATYGILTFGGLITLLTLIPRIFTSDPRVWKSYLAFYGILTSRLTHFLLQAFVFTGFWRSVLADWNGGFAHLFLRDFYVWFLISKPGFWYFGLFGLPDFDVQFRRLHLFLLDFDVRTFRRFLRKFNVQTYSAFPGFCDCGTPSRGGV